MSNSFTCAVCHGRHHIPDSLAHLYSDSVIACPGCLQLFEESLTYTQVKLVIMVHQAVKAPVDQIKFQRYTTKTYLLDCGQKVQGYMLTAQTDHSGEVRVVSYLKTLTHTPIVDMLTRHMQEVHSKYHSWMMNGVSWGAGIGRYLQKPVLVPGREWVYSYQKVGRNGRFIVSEDIMPTDFIFTKEDMS